MEKPLKIAVYSGQIPATTFVERLIHGLANRDFKILLFGAIVSGKENFRSKHAHIKNYGYYHNRLYKLLYLIKYSVLLSIFNASEKRKLQMFLKRQKRYDLYNRVKYYPVLYHKPDIFHLQWAKSAEEWMWVQDFGMKLVLSLRGAHINYSPIADLDLANTYRRIFPNISGFHAVSKAIAKEAQKYGANQNQIKVVYSGLDIPELKPSTTIDESVFNIISVGRAHWIKGYPVAIDACKYLMQHNIEFKYLIVGAAHDIELIYQIHDLELQNHITLVDAQPYSAIERLVQKCDVLLLPSHKEGIANVVLEAMALKTMVLTTDCGGMNEVVEDGHNGFMVPIRDPLAIAKKLKEISILNPAETLKITNNAFTTIQKQHNASEMIAGMLALYDQVLTA